MQNLEQIKDFIWETDYYNEFVNLTKKMGPTPFVDSTKKSTVEKRYYTILNGDLTN